jgi:hypothetical protein
MGDQYSTPILWNFHKAIGHHYADEANYEYIHNRYTQNIQIYNKLKI